MKLSALTPNIERSIDELYDSKFVTIVNAHVLDDRGRTKTLKFTSNIDKPPYLQNRFSRVDEYLYALRWNEYSFVIYDGSVIQIEYREDNSRIAYHRLCYFPCPIELDLTLDDLEQPLDEVVLAGINSGRLEIIKPFAALRFDYDAGNAKPGHPASHFTLISPDCRIPVQEPMGLERFLEFVFRNFYAGDAAKWAPALKHISFNLDKCISDEETNGIHFGWRKPSAFSRIFGRT